MTDAELNEAAAVVERVALGDVELPDAAGREAADGAVVVVLLPRVGAALVAAGHLAGAEPRRLARALGGWRSFTCDAVALRRAQLRAAWRGEELGRAYSSISWEDDDHRH